ncbi:phage holin family protein [Flaviflagellibacter deserti]|uniref:Phage holin family protein n=1 Tax=Flaviflagellibacter deserti TaxID=2267266 RepID=A0ABV9Z543_9HYPH
MLQTLLASGALFQGLKAEMNSRARQLGFMVACAVVALILFSIGLMALGVAAFILLTPIVGAAGAAGIVGGGAFLIGLMILLIGTRKKTAHAATSAGPVSAPSTTPFAGLANAAAQAPIPWLLGAMILGLVLGRKR